MKVNQQRVKDFTEKITMDNVYDDISKLYKVANIERESGESLYYIADALYRDYEMGRANYRGYISEGIDARLLMEVRKSMILNLAQEELNFIGQHKDVNTIEEVKEHRTKFLQRFIPDFTGEDWQLYMVMKYTWKAKAIDIDLDFESCFEDGDWRKQVNVDSYIMRIDENYEWIPKSYKERFGL